MKNEILATPMTVSVYPHEREALARLARELRLKSSFDVVRLLAAKSRLKAVRSGDFRPPKEKSY